MNINCCWYNYYSEAPPTCKAYVNIKTANVPAGHALSVQQAIVGGGQGKPGNEAMSRSALATYTYFSCPFVAWGGAWLWVA